MRLNIQQRLYKPLVCSLSSVSVCVCVSEVILMLCLCGSDVSHCGFMLIKIQEEFIDCTW